MLASSCNLDKSKVENLQAIPTELIQDRPQWVCAGPGKKPINPHTGRIFRRDPKHPWVQTPEKWTTFEQVCSRVGQPVIAGSGTVEGVGYVLAASDPYICIDLDSVRNSETGTVEPWAAEIVERFQSYTEVSMSGKGLHIFLASDSSEPLQANRWILPGQQEIEVYESGRYIAVTGNVYRYDSIKERTEELVELLETANPKGQAQNPSGKNGQGEKHKVNTAEMISFFSFFGIEVDPHKHCDQRFDCPGHDSDTDPTRGGHSLDIHPDKGYTCRGGCSLGKGGPGDAKRWLASRTDEELVGVSRRTKKSLPQLHKLREELSGFPEGIGRNPDDCVQLDQERVAHYLERLQARDGKQRIKSCGCCPMITNGNSFYSMHVRCQRWDCHFCGPRRRALEESVFGDLLEGLDELYVEVVSEQEWEFDKRRPMRFSRSGVRFRYIKTRTHARSIVLLSTEPLHEERATFVKKGERRALLIKLLGDMRKQRKPGERLLDGSRSWSTRRGVVRKKAKEEPGNRARNASEEGPIFRGIARVGLGEMLRIARNLGLTTGGELGDYELWPDGKKRPGILRFEIDKKKWSNFNKFIECVQMESRLTQFAGAG